MSPAPSTSLSSSPAARSPLPAAIPLKFRRKSQGPADVSPDPVVHAPFARTSAQRVWRDSYSSDASSPIASSAILSSEPSSPIEFSRVYYQSSPVNHYGCGARDPYDYAQQGSWTSSTDLPPSPSSSYYYARPRHHYSHSFRSYGSSFSYSSPSEGSEEPPMSSDFDVDAASVDLEDTRVELDDDVDIDDDLLPHHRRLSFSTSSERDRPLVREGSKPIPIPTTCVRSISVFASSHSCVPQPQMSTTASMKNRESSHHERNMPSMETPEPFATNRRRRETCSLSLSMSPSPVSDSCVHSPAMPPSIALPISALVYSTGSGPSRQPSTPPPQSTNMSRHKKSPSLAMLLNPSPPLAVEPVTTRVEVDPGACRKLLPLQLSESAHLDHDMIVYTKRPSLSDTHSDAEIPPLTGCNSAPEMLPPDQCSDAISSPLSSPPSSPSQAAHTANPLEEVGFLRFPGSHGAEQDFTEEVEADENECRTVAHTPLPKAYRHSTSDAEIYTQPSFRSPSPLISICSPPSVKVEREPTEPIAEYIDIESQPGTRASSHARRDQKRRSKGGEGRAKKKARMSTELEEIRPEDLFVEPRSEAKGDSTTTRTKRSKSSKTKTKLASHADDAAAVSKFEAPPSVHPSALKTGAVATDHVDHLAELHQGLPLQCAELQGMLIETLATSRASSLPASALYSALIATRPALKELSNSQGEKVAKKEWVCAIEAALEAGRIQSGVFGKVESVQAAADHTLEAQWFYQPEEDQDQERATLLRSIMPRPGKRSETKKCKQYYWRPLAKISRWDPEDDL